MKNSQISLICQRKSPNKNEEFKPSESRYQGSDN